MSKPKSAPRPRSQMSDEDFVTLWQSSATKDAVESGYDISLPAAVQRARVLRKNGVKLKEFGRSARAVDVDALNKIAASAAKSVKA